MILNKLLAILALSIPAIAGEKTIPFAAPQLGPNGVHFSDNAQIVPLSIPKWNGRDANGNFIGYHTLRRIEVGFTTEYNFSFTISNNLAIPRPWWTYIVGCAPVLSFDSVKDLTDFIPQKKDSIIAPSGSSFEANETKYYPIMNGCFAQFEKIIGTPRELRLVSGTGNMNLNLILTQYEDRAGISGHGWATTTDLSLVGIQSGPYVKFIYDETATEFLRSKEIRVQLPMILFTQDMPYVSVDFSGFNIDPSRIVKGEITLSPHCFYYDGIENRTSAPMVCGGTSSFHSSIYINGKYAIFGGVNRGVGSGGQPLSAFDGILDFKGSSGAEDWSASNSSMPTTNPLCLPGDPFEVFNVCPVDLIGSNLRLDLVVDQNNNNYTPVPDFAWWNANLIGGEVIIRIWYH